MKTKWQWPIRGVVLVGVALLVLLSWHPGVQTVAAEQIDSGFKRALLTFASARALNAVISVLQGTEVVAQPLGFGFTFTVGQALEPVNRAIEQFSTVMLYVAVAFGIQKALLAIGSWWLVSAVLTGLAIVWAVLYAIGRPQLWLSRLLLMLLLIRFAVPAVTVGSDYAFHRFLAHDYAAAQKYLDAAPGEVKRLTPVDPEQKGSAQRLGAELSAPFQSMSQKFANLRLAAEQGIQRMIDLTVVFLLQTILLPLLFFWLLYTAVRKLLIGSAGSALGGEHVRDLRGRTPVPNQTG